MTKSQVLHVVPGLGVSTGGTAFGVVELATALGELGVQTTILATDIATAAQARTRRFALAPAEMPPDAQRLDIRLFPVSFPRRLVFSPQLRKAIEREVGHFDLVHIHSLFLYPQYISARHARKAKVPYVVSPHGSLDPYLRQRGRVRKWITEVVWQRRMINLAAALHLTTAEECTQVLALGYRCVHHSGSFGISSGWFEPYPPRSKFRLRFLDGFDGPMVLFHGRITRKKGLPILIEAFAGVRDSVPSAKLVIVGPDEEDLGTELVELVRHLGLADSVHFVQMLRDDDLKAALSAADVWAMASHGENFGMAVVEALAAGLPVVVSEEVNVGPEIRRARAGVVTELSATTFTNALVGLLEKPALRNELSGRARELAKRFQWSYAATDLVDLYRTVQSTKSCPVDEADQAKFPAMGKESS